MPRMKWKALAVAMILTVVLSSTSCTLWAEKKHSGWRTVTAGEDLVRLFWGDVKSKNWESVETHIAPGFVGVTAAGAMDRTALIQHLRAMDLQDFQVGEVKAQSAGADLMVSYTISVRGSISGHPLPDTTLHMLTVWQQLKKGWVMVANTAVAAQK